VAWTLNYPEGWCQTFGQVSDGIMEWWNYGILGMKSGYILILISDEYHPFRI
jgi:hypothetical protein